MNDFLSFQNYTHYQYSLVLESVITEIKNEYYQNKSILYNKEIYKIEPNSSFYYVSLVKDRHVLVGTLEQVHEWII